MENDVRSALSELVQAEGEAFYGDPARVESRMRERVPDRAAEVAVLVTAVRAGVVDELQGVKPGLFDIAVGHLTGRMVRMFDADPDAAHWAVEAWANALGTATPPRSGDAVGRPDPHERPQNEQVEVARALPSPATQRRFSISWAWVAAIGAGAIGVIALIVLLRMVVGLVRTDDGGTAHPTTATSTPTTSTTVPANAQALSVPPGLNLGTGDVQVTLLWADGNDLDLHVIDPSGAEIYFSNPKSPTGGTLDHDDTAGCAATGTHAENVFWPTGHAPPGRYRVFVKNYTSCGSPSRYSLRASAKGKVTIESTGSVGAREGDQTPVSEFSF